MGTPAQPPSPASSRAGVHTFTASVQESWQLHFWILSQGPAITVLKPVSLRQQVISALEETLAAYQTK